MIGDLPEIDDIFNESKKEKETKIDISDDELELIDKNIYLYISKGNGKWISVAFLEIAPGGIGLHVFLPLEIKISTEEAAKLQLKFEQKSKSSSKILKEVPVLLRWRERDQISGKMKLGLHFHGEVKNEPSIIEILKILKNQKDGISHDL